MSASENVLRIQKAILISGFFVFTLTEQVFAYDLDDKEILVNFDTERFEYNLDMEILKFNCEEKFSCNRETELIFISVGATIGGVFLGLGISGVGGMLWESNTNIANLLSISGSVLTILSLALGPSAGYIWTKKYKGATISFSVRFLGLSFLTIPALLFPHPTSSISSTFVSVLSVAGLGIWISSVVYDFVWYATQGNKSLDKR